VKESGGKTGGQQGDALEMIIFCLSVHHLWGRTLAKYHQDACAVAYANDAYDIIISTLLQYIQANGIVVPIIDNINVKKMYYVIVTDKLDAEDKYTVKYFSTFPDETYSGADIWGFISKYWGKNRATLDSNVPMDVFLEIFMQNTSKIKTSIDLKVNLM
jgi:hypothetical protein